MIHALEVVNRLIGSATEHPVFIRKDRMGVEFGWERGKITAG